MCNIIKADLYRLIRTKSLYISLIITAVVAFLWTIASAFNFENSQLIYAPTQKELAYFMSDFIISSNLVNFTLITILVSFFVNAEYKNGFIKNYAGNIPNKTKWVGSKLITAALIVFAILFVSCAVGFVTQFVIGGFYLASVVSLGKMLLTQFLLHLAFASLMLFVSSSIESSALSIILGLFISFGVMGLLYTGIDFIFKNILHINFTVQNYTVSGNVSQVYSVSTIDVIVRALIVSVAAIILFSILTCIVQKKKEIK